MPSFGSRPGPCECGTLGEVRVAEGGRNVGMAEQPGNDAKAHPVVDRDDSMGIAQVIDAELAQPRSIANCIPCLCPERGVGARGPKHLGAIIPQVLRGEAGASQIARGPTLESGNTARSL